MKKILFMVAFLLVALVSNAQISWDVRVGANVSGIENSDAKMKLGFKVGAGVDYLIKNSFSVRPMLFFTSKGVSEGKNNLGFFPDKTIALNYIQMPILATHHIQISDVFSIAVNAGPYAAYRINKPANHDVIKYRSFDAGVNVGVDFILKRFVLGVEAEYGFTKLSKIGPKLHNINYSLMLGYKF